MDDEVWKSKEYNDEYDWLVNNIHPVTARTKAKSCRLLNTAQLKELASMDNSQLHHNEKLLLLLEGQHNDGFRCLLEILHKQKCGDVADRLQALAPELLQTPSPAASVSINPDPAQSLPYQSAHPGSATLPSSRPAEVSTAGGMDTTQLVTGVAATQPGAEDQEKHARRTSRNCEELFAGMSRAHLERCARYLEQLLGEPPAVHPYDPSPAAGSFVGQSVDEMGSESLPGAHSSVEEWASVQPASRDDADTRGSAFANDSRHDEHVNRRAEYARGAESGQLETRFGVSVSDSVDGEAMETGQPPTASATDDPWDSTEYKAVYARLLGIVRPSEFRKQAFGSSLIDREVRNTLVIAEKSGGQSAHNEALLEHLESRGRKGFEELVRVLYGMSPALADVRQQLRKLLPEDAPINLDATAGTAPAGDGSSAGAHRNGVAMATGVQYSSAGAAADQTETNPWRHEKFPDYHAWLMQLDPTMFRNNAYSARLIGPVEKSQLAPLELRGPQIHNDKLLELASAPGTRESFQKLLNTLKRMGPNYKSKLDEISMLLI